MLLLLSAVILVFMSIYGVIAPMVIRDILGNGDIFVYPDSVSLDLKANSTDVAFKGEFFITRNNIDAFIHETFYKIFYQNKPVLSLTLSGMKTYVSKRTNLDFSTKLEVYDADLMDKLIMEALHGNNSDVIMQGFMGVSVFNVPAYQNVFVERYLLPSNTNMTKTIQESIDGTTLPSTIDPTLDHFPKTVIPPLNIPEIKTITIFRKDNRIGVEIHFLWLNDFITIYIKSLKLPVMLGNTVIGGLFVDNVNLEKPKTNSKVKLGLYLNQGKDVKNAFEESVTRLIENLILNVGISGPVELIGHEFVEWIYKGTKSLALPLHLDIPKLLNRTNSHLPAIPKAILDLSAYKLNASIKTIKNKLEISADIQLPEKFPKLPTIQSLMGFEVTIDYIKTLLDIDVGKLLVKHQKISLTTALTFYNNPASLKLLIDKLLGKRNNVKDKLIFHNLNFLPSCDTCSTFDNVNIKVTPPTINSNQYSKFMKAILSNTDLKLKILSLSVVQSSSSLQSTLFRINLDFTILQLPINVQIGYLSAVIQLNNKNAIKLTVINFVYNPKASKQTLEVNVELLKTMEWTKVAQKILDFLDHQQDFEDTFTVTSFLVGSSKDTVTTLFNEIEVTLPIKPLLENLPSNDLKSNLEHLITPQHLSIDIKDDINLSLAALVRNPLYFNLNLHLLPISVQIDGLLVNIDSISYQAHSKQSNLLQMDVKIQAVSSIKYLVANLLKNRLNGDLSLKLGSFSALNRLQVELDLVKSSSNSNLLDLSKMNLNHPISQLHPQQVSINQDYTSFRIKADIAFALNVPVHFYISKFSVILRLENQAFLHLKSSSIALNAGQQFLNLDISATLLNCNHCQKLADGILNQFLNVNVGFESLILGDMIHLNDLIVDLPISMPIPSLKSSPLRLNKIILNKVVVRSHLNSIIASISLSNPLPWLTVHLESIQIVIALNQAKFVKINLHHLSLSQQASISVAFDFYDAKESIKDTYMYLTTSFSPSPTIEIYSLQLSHMPLNLHLRINMNQLVAPHLLDINDLIVKTRKSTISTPLPFKLLDLEIIHMEKSLIEAVIHAGLNLDFELQLDLSLSLQLNLNDKSLISTSASVKTSSNKVSIHASVMVSDTNVMADVGDLISTLFQTNKLKGKLTLHQLRIGSIESFALLAVDVDLSVLNVPTPETFNLPKIDQIHFKSFKNTITSRIGVQFKMPDILMNIRLAITLALEEKLLTLQIIPQPSFITIKIIFYGISSGQSDAIGRIANDFINFKDLNLNIQLFDIQLHNNYKGTFAVHSPIPIAIHKHLKLPSLSFKKPSVSLETLSGSIESEIDLMVALQYKFDIAIFLDTAIEIIVAHQTDLFKIKLKVESNVHSVDLKLKVIPFNQNGENMNEFMDGIINKNGYIIAKGLKIGAIKTFERISIRLDANKLPTLGSIHKPNDISLKLKGPSLAIDKSIQIATQLLLKLPFHLDLKLPKIQLSLGLQEEMIQIVVDPIQLLTNHYSKLKVAIYCKNEQNLLLGQEIENILRFKESNIVVDHIQLGSIALMNKIHLKIPFKVPLNWQAIVSNWIQDQLDHLSINSLDNSDIVEINYLNINQIKNKVDLSIEAHLPLNASISISKLSLQVRSDHSPMVFLSVVPLELTNSIFKSKMYLELMNSRISSILGINQLEIGQITLFNRVVVDIELHLKLPPINLNKLPKIQLPSIFSKSISIDDQSNKQDAIVIDADLVSSHLSLNLDVEFKFGAITNSIKLHLKLLTIASQIHASISLNGNGSMNELVAMKITIEQLLDGKSFSVFLGSIQLSSFTLDINKQLTLPPLTLPSTSITLPHVAVTGIHEINISIKDSIKLGLRIALTGLHNYSANLHGIQLLLNGNHQDMAELTFVKLELIQMNGFQQLSMEIMIDLYDVNDDLQFVMRSLVDALLNNSLLPNLSLNLEHVILPHFNLLQLAKIKVPIPKTISKGKTSFIPLPSFKNITIDNLHIGNNNMNQLSIEGAIQYLSNATIHADIDAQATIQLNHQLLLKTQIKAQVDQIAQIASKLQFYDNAKSLLNPLIDDILNKRELQHSIQIGILLKKNLLNKVSISIPLKDLVTAKKSNPLFSTSNTAIENIITNVVGGLVETGIEATLNVNVPVTTSIQHIKTHFYKQDDELFTIDVDISLPTIKIHLKPTINLQKHMSQIYRRMKLGINVSQDMSIRGIEIDQFNLFNELIVNKLPPIEYVEGKLVCRIHSPLKLISDPGIGTDVFFPMTTLSIPVDFDMGEIYFDVFDYKHYNQTLSNYDNDMAIEQQHIDELQYPLAIDVYKGNTTGFIRYTMHKDHLKYYNVNPGLNFFIRWVGNPLLAPKGLLQVNRKKLLRNFKCTVNGKEIGWFGSMLEKTNVYVHVYLGKFPDFPMNPRPDRPK